MTIVLQDSNSVYWQIGVTDAGLLTTVVISPAAITPITLNNSANTVSWQLGVTTGGLLTTTSVSFSAANPVNVTLTSATGASMWNLGVLTDGQLTTTFTTLTFQPIGFAPNWLEGQQNKGLGVYIATGTINRVTGYGNVVIFVPNNAMTYIYVFQSGQVTSGPSIAPGAYGIALVKSGTLITGGNTVAGLKGPLGPWAGLTTDPGILNIQDIRVR